MNNPEIVSYEAWTVARAELLTLEKEHTRRGDQLARRRHELPWVRIDKRYTFGTDKGPRTLTELFGERSQLVIYHFMFGPDYEAGCPVCSSIADGFNGILEHLKARDVTMICMSRRPAREAAGLPRPHGMELRLGIEQRKRIQLRLRPLRDEGNRRHLVSK